MNSILLAYVADAITEIAVAEQPDLAGNADYDAVAQDAATMLADSPALAVTASLYGAGEVSWETLVSTVRSNATPEV